MWTIVSLIILPRILWVNCQWELFTDGWRLIPWTKAVIGNPDE